MYKRTFTNAAFDVLNPRPSDADTAREARTKETFPSWDMVYYSSWYVSYRIMRPTLRRILLCYRLTERGHEAGILYTVK